MCDINQATDLKTVNVYKVCYKIRNKYYACFSHIKIFVGSVSISTSHYRERLKVMYAPSFPVYNENMIDKTTGFKNLKHARYLQKRFKKIIHDDEEMVILKIKLGGEIMQGTGKNIVTSSILDSAITYAGTEILEIEEVKDKCIRINHR